MSEELLLLLLDINLYVKENNLYKYKFSEGH